MNTIDITTHTKFSGEFLAQLFENYPEAGSGCAMNCTGWDNSATGLTDFTKHGYDIVDTEMGKKYNLTFPKMVKGFKKFIQARNNGELQGIHWEFDTIDKDGNAVFDYDGETVDAICQFALLGEVIYG